MNIERQHQKIETILKKLFAQLLFFLSEAYRLEDIVKTMILEMGGDYITQQIFFKN